MTTDEEYSEVAPLEWPEGPPWDSFISSGTARDLEQACYARIFGTQLGFKSITLFSVKLMGFTRDSKEIEGESSPSSKTTPSFRTCTRGLRT